MIKFPKPLHRFLPEKPHCRLFQNKALEDFIKNDKEKIEKIEIIGHDIGPVDDTYFETLNQLIPEMTVIKYWLFDKTKEGEKKQKLQELFPGHIIQIIYYP